MMRSINVLAMIVTAAALLADAAPADGFGGLKGRLIVSENVPPPPIEPVGNHPHRPLALVEGAVPHDDNLVVGVDGGLRDVFVMMYTRGKGADAPIHDSYNDAADQIALSIDNVDCRFVPHALFVRTGQSVKLKNSDTVGHNCHITTFNNEHNVTLPAGSDADIVLANSDRLPGQITCDIHQWMDAVILVRDNPYVDISKTDGRFEIKNVPEGEWQFQFWHKKSGYLRKLQATGYQVGRRGEVTLTIQADQTLDMGTMKVPAEALSK